MGLHLAFIHDGSLVAVKPHATAMPHIGMHVAFEQRNSWKVLDVVDVIELLPTTNYYSGSSFRPAMQFLTETFGAEVLEQNHVSEASLKAGLVSDDPRIQLVLVILR